MKFEVIAVTKFIHPVAKDDILFGAFSHPAKGDIIESNGLNLAGWVLNRKVRLAKIVIYFNDVSIDVPLDIASPDVKKQFPNVMGAEQSRFVYNGDSLIFKHITQIYIAAVDTNGKSYEVGAVILKKLPTKNLSQPIFIVGSPRSGTSVLNLSLINCLQLGKTATGEGHFMPLVHDVFCDVEKYYENNAAAAKIKGVLLSRFNAGMINQQLAEMFKLFYHRFYKEDVFIDKTPGWKMIEAIPSILQLYPDAYFIFAKRRGLENILSRQKKFPDMPFVTYCKDWSASMNMWLKVKESIPASQRLEIDQYDLAHHPLKVVTHLQKMLALPEEHKNRLLDFFKTQKIERTADDWLAVSIDELKWTSEEKNIFLKECGETLNLYGYSLDSNYFK